MNEAKTAGEAGLNTLVRDLHRNIGALYEVLEGTYKEEKPVGKDAAEPMPRELDQRLELVRAGISGAINELQALHKRLIELYKQV